MFDQVITLARETAKDKFGNSTFGLAINYNARINYKNTLVLKSDGTEQVASAVLWIESNIIVGLTDQIKLPNGNTPKIISVEQKLDNSELTYTKVFFA